MKVELRLGGLISVNGCEIALGQTFALLDGIARERSVRGAAQRLALSYRSAWGRVVLLEKAIGRPVVIKTKGHGTVLTRLGEDLRQALQRTLRQFEPELIREQRALEQRLAGLVSTRPSTLRVAASHDPLLMEILSERADVDVAVVGSAAALERLADGLADIAGCHFGSTDALDLPAGLRDPDFVARPAFVRQQGLILASGNPLGIRGIADLRRTKARFVNRQKGSGTRAWFDRLLTEQAISPTDIIGYGTEEFTHQAVAAMIASGAADAGLGVRAVARAFGLAFVPLGRETYFLVARTGSGLALAEDIAIAARRRSTGAAGYATEPAPAALPDPPGSYP